MSATLAPEPSSTESVHIRRHAGSPSSGSLGVVAMGFTVWLGLWITPPDQCPGEPGPAALHPSGHRHRGAVLGRTGGAAGGSLLLPLAADPFVLLGPAGRASVEVGAVFAALTLVTGSIWGRPVWGVWWTWDARLTSTALLLLLEIGYLALRRVPAEPAIRARRCAVAALLIAIDIPIVHFSVDWWNTLHQGGTFIDPGFQIHASRLHVVDLPPRLHRVLADLRVAPRHALPVEVLQDQWATRSSRSR